MNISEIISEELSLKLNSVDAAIKLIDEGNTIPFIARYRKEATNYLTDNDLRKLEERLIYLRKLDERIKTVLNSINEQGKLTPELEEAINNCRTLSEVEDLYRPYKPKKRTRASIAKEKGLEPLAKAILEGQEDILEFAKSFINEEKKVNSVEEAISGAKDIIAENLSDVADYRIYIKKVIYKNGKIISKEIKKDEKDTYKDYSDWFLEPLPELYIRESDDINLVDMYNQNMADAAATRARVEELLSPKKPSENLWVTNCAPMPAPRPEYVAQDLTELVNVTFGTEDGCPFETETECEIWRRKPIVRETVSPRSPKIRADKMNEFISAARCDENITANNPLAAPLLERYKMLMGSANACCTDGMAYSLKQAGASDGLVYKFLADDANFYGFGARCLMMTDEELDTKYPNTATAAVAADVRNGCLCRGRQWFYAMLAPFQQAYKEFPEFANYKFNYTYTDGLQREITVSVNNDVQNVLKQLALCP